MVQIVLIRPGATDYDEQRRVQGNLDVPLSETGTAEVARVIEEIRGLNLEVLYSSPGQPALQTAEMIAAALDIKLKKQERMDNVDLGLWQGKSIDEIRLKQPKIYRIWQEMPENVSPPEGEMLSDADERVRTAMSKIVRRHRDGGAIGVVASEPVVSLIRRYLTHGELGDLWKAGSEHGRWEVLEVTPEALATP